MFNITSKYSRIFNNKPPESWIVHIIREILLIYDSSCYSSMIIGKRLKLSLWKLVKKCKPFFQESKAIFETFQNFSPFIRVFYQLILKSVEVLNQFFWDIEYWYKARKCQIVEWIQKRFSGKIRQTLKLSKYFSPILEFL